MRVRLRAADIGRVAFGCSPAHEALRSLHVLAAVKHHPLHISWVLEARGRLDADLRQELDNFAFWCHHRPLNFRRIWRPADLRAWPDELAALRDAPIEYYAEQLLAGALEQHGRGRLVRLEEFLDDSDAQVQAISRIESQHPASVPVMRELIADPEQSRKRFVEFLSSYWDVCLAPEWPRLERHLRADITRRGRAGRERGLVSMLEDLAPQLRIVEDGGEVILSPRRRRTDVPPLDLTLTEQDELVLVPSHFAWPRVAAVAGVEQWAGGKRQTVQITYALAEMQRQARPPVPPDDLLKLLRAAAHPTRLQILQLLAGRSRSTREIAELIGLTEAAISKHLKLLAEAGWAEPERHSYYVYYRLRRDSGARLGDALKNLLG